MPKMKLKVSFVEEDPLGDFRKKLLAILAEEQYGNLQELRNVLEKNSVLLGRYGETGGLIFKAGDSSYTPFQIGRIVQFHGLKMIIEFGYEQAVEKITSMWAANFKAMNVADIDEDYMSLPDYGRVTLIGKVTTIIRKSVQESTDMESFLNSLRAKGVHLYLPHQKKETAYSFDSKLIQEVYLPRDCRYHAILDSYSHRELIE